METYPSMRARQRKEEEAVIDLTHRFDIRNRHAREMIALVNDPVRLEDAILYEMQDREFCYFCNLYSVLSPLRLDEKDLQTQHIRDAFERARKRYYEIHDNR